VLGLTRNPALQRAALDEIARAQRQFRRDGQPQLFKVAARVVVSARRVVFHLASSYPYREVFRAVYERLTGPAAVPAPDGS
jgi:Transposase DDE domain group 1